MKDALPFPKGLGEWQVRFERQQAEAGSAGATAGGDRLSRRDSRWGPAQPVRQQMKEGAV